MGLSMRNLLLALVIALGASGSAAAEPVQTTRKVEVLQHRPSGFWTSNRPAVGGAYRWRMLGIGVALAAGAGALMWKLTRRANAVRAAGPDAQQTASRRSS